MVEIFGGERIEELGINGMRVLQSDKLYRFTSDAIKLTRFASCRKGDRVADFCSGSGIVGLHFYALHAEEVRSVDMYELQRELAGMSERSVALNGLSDKIVVHEGRVQDIGREKNNFFSLVLCNPPYGRAGSGEKSLNRSDLIARHEVEITLAEIIEVAGKKLKFGGRLCMCHRAERLAEIISLMRQNGIEPKRAAFQTGKNGVVSLALIEGIRGGKPGMKITVDA